MKIIVQSKRKSIENLKKEYGNVVIFDLTSKSQSEFVKFSPFYPHNKIPVPFSIGTFSQSVEGVWQGLKVFANEGIDISKFEIANMKNIKRTIRKHGEILGHQKGIHSDVLLSYKEARLEIYIPTYNFILNNYLMYYAEKISKLMHKQDIILLDYETNCNINDLTRPLSHCFLVKKFIELNFI